MDDLSRLVPELAVLIVALGFVYKILTLAKTVFDDLRQSIDKMAESNQQIAIATRQAAQEAKDRNGHLGEQNEHIAELVVKVGSNMAKLADRNFKAYQNVKQQHVEHQHVRTEVVEHMDTR